MLKFIFSLFIFFHAHLIAETIEGKVIGVSDGDSLTLLSKSKLPIKIRLNAIDAPEIGQDFGTKSKQALSEKVFGHFVSVDSKGKDKYGRTIGIVSINGIDINHWMVKNGWAWQYVKYDQSENLKVAQASAKHAKLGIWSQKRILAPWVYRANIKRHNALKKQSKAGAKMEYWLNTSSNSRHNNTCKWFKKTTQGRVCKPNEGKACGACGG